MHYLFQIVADSPREAKRKVKEQIKARTEGQDVPKGHVEAASVAVAALIDAVDAPDGYWVNVVVGDDSFNVEVAKDLREVAR